MEYIGKIENDRKLLINEEGIVIFGAGRELEWLLDRIEEMKIKNKLLCICDNAKEQQGRKVEGIKVVTPEKAFQSYKNAIYIVYNRFCVEISEQLVEKAIERIHLIRR